MKAPPMLLTYVVETKKNEIPQARRCTYYQAREQWGSSVRTSRGGACSCGYVFRSMPTFGTAKCGATGCCPGRRNSRRQGLSNVPPRVLMQRDNRSRRSPWRTVKLDHRARLRTTFSPLHRGSPARRHARWQAMPGRGGPKRTYCDRDRHCDSPRPPKTTTKHDQLTLARISARVRVGGGCIAITAHETVTSLFALKGHPGP